MPRGGKFFSGSALGLDERHERPDARVLRAARIDQQRARLRPETVQRAKNDAGDPQSAMLAGMMLKAMPVLMMRAML